MRKATALGCLLLGLLMAGLPASAGLGDLLGGGTSEPAGGSLLGELVEEVIAPTTEPILEVTEPVTEVVVVPVVESVVVPVVEVTDATVEVVAKTAEPVLSPTTDDDSGLVKIPPVLESDDPETKLNPTVVDIASGANGGLVLIEPPVAPIALAEPSATAAPSSAIDREIAIRVLLTGIQASPVTIVEPAPSTAAPLLPSPQVETLDWLSTLKGWLGQGAASLLEVLAIPMRLLEVLIRALTSSGAGLIAPAVLLATLLTGHRKLFSLT